MVSGRGAAEVAELLKRRQELHRLTFVVLRGELVVWPSFAKPECGVDSAIRGRRAAAALGAR